MRVLSTGSSVAGTSLGAIGSVKGQGSEKVSGFANEGFEGVLEVFIVLVGRVLFKAQAEPVSFTSAEHAKRGRAGRAEGAVASGDEDAGTRANSASSSSFCSGLEM